MLVGFEKVCGGQFSPACRATSQANYHRWSPRTGVSGMGNRCQQNSCILPGKDSILTVKFPQGPLFNRYASFYTGQICSNCEGREWPWSLDHGEIVTTQQRASICIIRFTSLLFSEILWIFTSRCHSAQGEESKDDLHDSSLCAEWEYRLSWPPVPAARTLYTSWPPVPPSHRWHLSPAALPPPVVPTVVR